MEKGHILFTVDNIGLIKSGRKTMTRRLVNPQPVVDHNSGYVFTADFVQDYDIHDWMGSFLNDWARHKVGDVVYIKEPYYQYGRWKKQGHTKSGKPSWVFVPSEERIYYWDEMDIAILANDPNIKSTKPGIYRRSAFFMPRKYARYFIEITSVGIEQLQSISQEDAKAEGVDKMPHRCPGWTDPLKAHRDCYICPYKLLWNEINGPKGMLWDKNPWVWVYSFKLKSS